MKLKTGDTVLIIATARCVIENDIVSFLTWAEAKGLKVELAPNLFAVENQFAGSDQQRAQDLIWALSHPKASAVFCARGGYGTIRTIRELEKIIESSAEWHESLESLMTSQWKHKLFVGFSDVTVLHSWLNRFNWVSVHGPVVTQWSLTDFSKTLNSLEIALFEGLVELDVQDCFMLNAKPFSGKLVGGNLSLMYALLATPYRINTVNTVLILEDLDEYLYHLDRMMQTLDLSGALSNIQALIVGGMSEMKDNPTSFGHSAFDIIHQVVSKYSIPVIFDVQIGHLSTNNSVFMGASITFDGRYLLQSINPQDNA